MTDPIPPIRAVCPSCGQPTDDLFRHWAECPDEDDSDLRREESGKVVVDTLESCNEIEALLGRGELTPDEVARYEGILAEMRYFLGVWNDPDAVVRRLIAVLRKKGRLIE